MRPERDAAPAATPPGAGGTSTPGEQAVQSAVQQAIEQFVELHSTGQAPDPATFAARWPEPMRPAVLAQCRQFLAFDGLLGHQEWQPAPPKETHGRTFGDFVIQEELGRGGMGVVYLAHQKSLNRRIALKVMASGLTLSKRHVERFRREAAAAAQLHHPAIVAVHALTEVDGTFALAMDYVAGRNLADILDDLRLANGEGALTIEGTLGLAPDKGYVAECAMFVAELASALAAAHQANVVHRDLKPRNLMLDDRRQVRLLDFGLAKSLGEGSISMSGEITGTAHYLSPEQTLAKRVAVDHRADIWALGVILYEMLTLRRPFDGKNLQQVVYEICFQEPVPMQKRNHKVPRDLVTICQKALEKDPSKRYQTAAELQADLLRFLSWEPIHAKPASTTTRVLKWMRRHRTETAIAAIAAVAGLVALALDLHQGRQAHELLAQAEVAYQAERFDDATALVAQALAHRNDEPMRERHRTYSEAKRRVQAEAAELAYRATNEIGRDRAEAIRLALLAVDKHASTTTRSAVLDALGTGNVTRLLRDPNVATPPQLVGASWSPDSRLVATVGYSAHVQLWDRTTGLPVVTLRGHAPDAPPKDGAAPDPQRARASPIPVIGAVFAGNHRLVTAGVDHTLRSWRTADGALERTVRLPSEAAAISSSRDGSRVLVVANAKGATSTAQVYATDTLEPVAPAVAQTLLFAKGTLRADGGMAATAHATSAWVVKVWPIVPGAAPAVRSLETPEQVRALAFSPDGALLAIATGAEVLLLRVADHTVVGRARHGGDVTALAFDHDGKRLLSGSRDKTARLWRLVPSDGGATELRETATLVGHSGPVDHVAFDPTDRLALTATRGQVGKLQLFDMRAGGVATGVAIKQYEVGASVESAEFAPDGTAVLARGAQSLALVWDFGATKGVVATSQTAGPGALAFDPRHARLLTAASDECIRAWAAADGKIDWTTPRCGQPQTGIDVDATHARFASWGRRDRVVHVRALADGAALHELTVPGTGVDAARFHCDGARLMTAGEAAADRGSHEASDARGTLTVWNTADWTTRCALERPRPIVAADASVDGAVLATVEEGEAKVRLWHGDGSARGELATTGERAVVRFAPDGASLLVAERDGAVRVLALDGRVLSTFATGAPLRFATFSADGARVLTCGEEAVLWHAADGTELLRCRGHRGAIEWGAFSADGASVATTARDGTICIWPTDPAAVARRLVSDSRSTPPAAPATAPTAK